MSNMENNVIQPLSFGDICSLNNIFLAPLAGYSHKPMRMFARKFGAGYAVTEMVSVEGVLRDSEKTFRYADISDAPDLTSIQLFGSCNPKAFYQAAMIVKKRFNARSININFGCPAPKVMKNGAGSRLLQEPQKMVDVINAVKDAGLAVEAKIRAGFDQDNLDDIINKLDRSDVDVIMLHCRLTSDKFLHGTADWKRFHRARQATHKLLIANGDIKSPEDAYKILTEYKMDGVMIGRAAIGRPYIFRQIIDLCRKGTYSKPSVKQQLEMLTEYARLWCGESKTDSVIPIRGALMSGLTEFEGAAKLRSLIAQSKNLHDLDNAIKTIKDKFILHSS